MLGAGDIRSRVRLELWRCTGGPLSVDESLRTVRRTQDQHQRSLLRTRRMCSSLEHSAGHAENDLLLPPRHHAGARVLWNVFNQASATSGTLWKSRPVTSTAWTQLSCLSSDLHRTVRRWGTNALLRSDTSWKDEKEGA